LALKTPEERYQEWLERLDIPLEETATEEAFKTLLEELGFTENQREALWEAATYRYEKIAPIGIRPVIIVYPWGREVRYGIKGRPGLWGYERMKEIAEELRGEQE